MTTLRKAVAKRIKELLKERNITRCRLGLNSGISHSTISAILMCGNDDVKFSMTVKIAGGFDMSVSEFTNSSLFNEDNLKV